MCNYFSLIFVICENYLSLWWFHLDNINMNNVLAYEYNDQLLQVPTNSKVKMLL